MDKAIQDTDELRDEELYALLDKAWETERLCVSEDLIQKTLKRAAEEADAKVISFETAKRRISPMKYVSAAVAAVFVAVLGLNAFGNGGLLANKAQMESTADNAMGRTESAVAYEPGDSGAAMAEGESGSFWYSTADSALADETERPETRGAAEKMNDEVYGMSGVTLTLSAELSDALVAVGKAPVSDTVECWEFVEGDTDWEEELMNSLKAAEMFGNELPTSGTYRYVLECNDGTQRVLEYNQPLDLIIRIETIHGSLWGLFGAESVFIFQ